MAEETLKPGTWVRVKNTHNVTRNFGNPSAVGYEFQITKGETYKLEKRTVYLDKENKYRVNYTRDDLLIIKKPKNMATKTKNSNFELENGQYFTATFNRKKVRGYVHYNGWDEYLLCGKGFPEEACNDDAEGWPTSLTVYAKDNHTEALKEEGVTNFVVCNDKRQKAIIDKDKIPEFLGYRVAYDGDTLSFGCGAVKVSKKDAVVFNKVLAVVDGEDARDYLEVISDYDEDRLEAYYNTRKKLEGFTPAQVKTFLDVANEVNDESELEGLSSKEVSALLAKL